MASKKILLIEADRAFSGELSKVLGAKGFEVTIGEDGRAGLDMLKKERPDAIVLCVELPQMSGYSVCNKIKKDGEFREIPLLIMSSEATPETFQQHRKLKTHADDYLIKPFKTQELVDCLVALVGAPDGDDVDVELSVGDAEIVGEELSQESAQEQKHAKHSDGEVFKEEDLKFLDNAFDNIMEAHPEQQQPGEVHLSVKVDATAPHNEAEVEVDLSSLGEEVVAEPPVQPTAVREQAAAITVTDPALVAENEQLKRQVESLKHDLAAPRTYGLDDGARKVRPVSAREQEEINRLRSELRSKEDLLREEMDKRRKLDEKVAELISELGMKDDQITSIEEDVERLRGADREKSQRIREHEEQVASLRDEINRLTPYEVESTQLRAEVEASTAKISEMEEHLMSREMEMTDMRDQTEKAREDMAAIRAKAASGLEQVASILLEKRKEIEQLV
ncbi:MAG: response regulator [Myxococcota bacterium]|jgi:DNA-binding response OmpR family regulator